MTHNYIDSVNNQTKEATMRLYGAIGVKVDGDLFAQELMSLDECGLDLVKIRGNSPGGDVLQGMSIVSALLAMKTPVHFYNDGVVASMAAVIAVAADKIYMMDFSQFMIHDPSFGDSPAQTPKEKKLLARMKSMLQGVLSRRGKDEAEVSKLMSDETWFSAKEALEHNLCDEIVVSAKKGMSALTPQQIIAQIDAEYKPNQTDTMKLTNQAITLLNVSAEATEADVSSAVVALHARATAAEAKAKTAEDKLTEIEAAAATARKAEAKTLIDEAVKDGRINASAVPAYSALFEANHEQAKTALGSIAKRDAVTPQIGSRAEADEKFLAMSWQEIDKANRLGELKAKHPDAYAEKFEAQYGRKPKN